MSAHTPGPWRVDAACGGLAIESERHGNIGLVNLARASKADARLIAAAPELIEALRPFSALLAEHHDDLPDNRPIFGINGAVITAGDLRRARAAIAKAGAA